MLNYTQTQRSPIVVDPLPEPYYPYSPQTCPFPTWTAALAGTVLDGSTARTAVLKWIPCYPKVSGWYRGIVQGYIQGASSARPNGSSPFGATDHYKNLRQWAMPFTMFDDAGSQAGLPNSPVDGVLTVTPRTLEAQYTAWQTARGPLGIDYSTFLLEFNQPVYLDAGISYGILMASEVFLTARTTPAVEVTYDLGGSRALLPAWGNTTVWQKERYMIYAQTLLNISTAIGATETLAAPSGNAPTLGMLRRANTGNWPLVGSAYADGTTITSVSANGWCNTNHLLVRS